MKIGRYKDKGRGGRKAGQTVKLVDAIEMKDKIYSDELCELHGEVDPITGSINLSVLDTHTKKKLQSAGFPPAAIPEVVNYLQTHNRIICEKCKGDCANIPEIER